jgi:hypothetical protein
MTTFVLILTLNFGGVAITSIPGFESLSVCKLAGQPWNEAQSGKASFVCAYHTKVVEAMQSMPPQ